MEKKVTSNIEIRFFRCGRNIISTDGRCELYCFGISCVAGSQARGTLPVGISETQTCSKTWELGVALVLTNKVDKYVQVVI